MADHHIDSANIDYAAVAKHYLQMHGCYIASAPDLNHKPGNDLISDWYWPFPTYPDYRFFDPYEYDKSKKDNTSIPDPPKQNNGPKFPNDFEIVPDELKNITNIRNPIVTTLEMQDTQQFFTDVANYRYTGLVVQAREKKAYDISIVKPFFMDNERKTKLIYREVVTGHYYSIATFDGWKYHIYRGLLCCMGTVNIYENHRPKYSNSVPFGNSIYEEPQSKSLIKPKNKFDTKLLNLIIDTSEFLNGELTSIPLNQIIDIEEYNYIYDFTIYEGNLKILWKDWFITQQENNKLREYVWIPAGGLNPQTLYHEVIEHQKRYHCKCCEKNNSGG